MLGPSEPSGATAPAGQLRIIATTDLHGALLPYDYFTDTPTPGIGLLALGTTLAHLRDTTATTLLFDNGDFLQGTPLSDAVVTTPEWRAQNLHPMAETMNAFDYDAVTLGNHEFNFGLDVLTDTLRDLDCPVVSANIFHATDGAYLVDPFVILDRTIALDDGSQSPIRIGVIGVAPPQITTWDARVIGDTISTIDMVTAVANQIPAMKAAGADVVVLLAHSGIGPDVASPDLENAAVHLAALEGVDALVLGHTHQRLPGPSASTSQYVNAPDGTIHGKPAVMPGALGQSVGSIDLRVERRTDGWAVTGFETGLHPAQHAASGETNPDPLARLPATAKAHSDTLDYIRTPIGHTRGPFQSYFSMVSNCPIVQLINDAQRGLIEAEIAKTQWADLPVLSVASPFKSGGQAGAVNYIDIAAGPLAICNAAELYPYPNTVCALVLTGADIAQWLERAASVFQTIRPNGGDQPLIDDDFPSYDFDIFDGLSYEIDLSVPPRYGADGHILNANSSRITAAFHNGIPVAPDQRFVVATNNYRVGGGGGFYTPSTSRHLIDTKRATRDILVDHIKSGSPLQPAAQRNWAFASVDGAVGLFATGVGGRNSVQAVTDRTIIGFDEGPSGQMVGKLALG